jgi:hypothetical protein
MIEAICIGVEAGIFFELPRAINSHIRGNTMLTATETKIAASLGVSASEFEAARMRNTLTEAERELHVAAAAAGLVERKVPALLNRGPVKVTFRGNAS